MNPPPKVKLKTPFFFELPATSLEELQAGDGEDPKATRTAWSPPEPDPVEAASSAGLHPKRFLAIERHQLRMLGNMLQVFAEVLQHSDDDDAEQHSDMARLAAWMARTSMWRLKFLELAIAGGTVAPGNTGAAPNSA